MIDLSLVLSSVAGPFTSDISGGPFIFYLFVSLFFVMIMMKISADFVNRRGFRKQFPKSAMFAYPLRVEIGTSIKNKNHPDET